MGKETESIWENLFVLARTIDSGSVSKFLPGTQAAIIEIQRQFSFHWGFDDYPVCYHICTIFKIFWSCNGVGHGDLYAVDKLTAAALKCIERFGSVESALRAEYSSTR